MRNEPLTIRIRSQNPPWQSRLGRCPTCRPVHVLRPTRFVGAEHHRVIDSIPLHLLRSESLQEPLVRRLNQFVVPSDHDVRPELEDDIVPIDDENQIIISLGRQSLQVVEYSIYLGQMLVERLFLTAGGIPVDQDGRRISEDR